MPVGEHLPGSIHIHHHVLLVETIPHSAWAGEGGGSLQQIVEKLRAQGLNRRLIQSGEKAGKGRTRGKVLALKQGEKILRKRS